MTKSPIDAAYSSPKCPVCGAESCATGRFPNCIGCGLDVFAESERIRKEMEARRAAIRSAAHYYSSSRRAER